MSSAVIPLPLCSAIRSVLPTFPARPSEFRLQDLQQLRQHLRQLCNPTQIGENTAKNAEFTIKIGEFVIDRSYAMDFISKRSDAHHFKLSKWKDIKFSVHI